ncbi:MAG: hypothetical protein ACMZ7B_01010 [Balneola sp.]|mgnify:CR=1 FL=1
MNIYFMLLKALIREIIKDAIDSLAAFFRQLLRVLFFGEQPWQPQHEPMYEEPSE